MPALILDTDFLSSFLKIGRCDQSFRFPLERQPKESILRSFDLTVISRYFPEYEREIKKRL